MWGHSIRNSLTMNICRNMTVQATVLLQFAGVLSSVLQSSVIRIGVDSTVTSSHGRCYVIVVLRMVSALLHPVRLRVYMVSLVTRLEVHVTPSSLTVTGGTMTVRWLATRCQDTG